ncbi:hypothetical protein [Streptomyces olivaceus]|uniref:hypothetical protein n=1 Tax=Streptomyces olivaceus TaxID=47716 RepID=UPI0022EF968A|nr:hypothetical protein [Streptomyces olivaceus]GHI97993.1 hypothetical protein TPA0905_74640 [Streptomyces olivaceus]
MEPFVTAINMPIAALTLGLGVVKARAVRWQREWTLRLTASVLIIAGMIFLLATPAVYRAIGNTAGSPNICALLVPVATLTCVAHAHALTQLWHEDRRRPAVLRRTATRWCPVYGGAVVTMATLYFDASLGPAAPLRFAAAYAHVPQVVAFHFVYWAALITTVIVAVRECASLSIPGRPRLVDALRRAIVWFAIALGFDLVNVGLTAIALLGSKAGPHRLEGVAQSAWLATIASCIAANVALASMVLRSRRAERRDRRTLLALHDLVVKRDPGVKADPLIVLAPRWSLWTGFDTSLELNSLMAEIHDGCGRLNLWWSPLPAAAVFRLAPQWTSGGPPGEEWDLKAAQDAATVLYAVQARDAAQPAVVPRLPRLPGADIEPHADRQHLVQTARLLTHPVVREAVELAHQAQTVADSSAK